MVRRLAVVLVLAFASLGWPAAMAGAEVAAAAQAAGSLQADFNADGFVDRAVGVVAEDIGATVDAGAVNVLYGSATGLAGAGNQQFWQGAGGVAGVAEAGDLFSSDLAGSDQPAGSARMAA